MVLRQRDSMVVAPKVPTVGVKIADMGYAPSAEETTSWEKAPTEGQAAAEVTQECVQFRTDESDKGSGQSELDSFEIRRIGRQTSGRPV